MLRMRISALFILLIGAGIGYFVYSSEAPGGHFSFKFGLDLAGGTHLVYTADTSKIASGDVQSTMQSLRDVIERRVNLFGVGEPLVQVESPSVFSSDNAQRLIVELPGITDVAAAVKAIGATPSLEFRLAQNATDPKTGSSTQVFVETGLTGRLVQNAQLEFSSGKTGAVANAPIVALTFNDEGAKLFEKITHDHTGEVLGIFLDGQPISTPVIQETIAGGKATITGNFTPEAAKTLVRDLNFGALPVPITLAETSSIGPSLGAQSLHDGLIAGIIGILAVMAFMIIWYRVPGLVASVALTIYAALMLSIFKFIPVTLTAACIAGFILSIGMAVDANILIFERMKEEFRSGKPLREAMREGFSRAWPSIRDSNISSLITGTILFWFGASVVQGFALTFVIGVLISMISAILVTRTLLLAISKETVRSVGKFFFLSGLGF